MKKQITKLRSKISLLILLLLAVSFANGQADSIKKKQYTVSEIDYLREVCEFRYLYGTSYSMGSGFSRTYYEIEKIKAVEEMVRTYMAAGITGKQIYAEDKKKWEKRNSK